MMKPKTLPLVLLLSFAVPSAVMAYSPQQSSALEGLMNLSTTKKTVSLSPVREAVLRSGAQALGAQTGLIDGAAEILRAIAVFESQMDNTFRFGDLVLGQGVLPPVIVASHGDASIDEAGHMMRVAGSVYRLEQPARFFSGAPSWRDWLLMGLPVNLDYPAVPDNPQLLPRDEEEKAFWQQEVLKAYRKGREHASLTFDNNLAELERVYVGMRTFYELYARGMVSMPKLASVQDTVNRTDPNTIVVGDTVFQITVPADFNTNTQAWRPTQSQSSAERELLDRAQQEQAAARAAAASQAAAPSAQPVPPPQSAWPIWQPSPAQAPQPVAYPTHYGAPAVSAPVSAPVAAPAYHAPAPAPAYPQPYAHHYGHHPAPGYVPQAMPAHVPQPAYYAPAQASHHVQYAQHAPAQAMAQLPQYAQHSQYAQHPHRAAATDSQPMTGEQARAIRDRAVSHIRMYSAPIPASQAPQRMQGAYPRVAHEQSAPARAPAHQPAGYVVSPGETIYAIAARTGVHWQELLRLNGLNPDQASRIQPGLVLRVAE